MKEKLYYSHQCIEEDDIVAVGEALRAPVITRGDYVDAFEEGIALYCGVEYAVAFNSGSTALQAACFAAGINANDRVISTPNTFISTVGSAVQLGATPYLVDIDRTSGNLSLEKLAEVANRPRSRGRDIIIPVHFAGIAVDMCKLEQLIARPDTVVIEDGAHALGSRYPTNERVGSCAYSDMTIFSFHPAKNITTGEGGMVTTNDEKLAEKLRLFRNNGIVRKQGGDPWYYESHVLTGNYNFTDIQAALGLSQLKKLENFGEKRRAIMADYREKFADTPIKLFDSSHDPFSFYHLCVAQIPFESMKTTRTKLMEQLAEEGIQTQYHYVPLYRHPVLSSSRLTPNDFPQMEAYYREALSLPLYPQMDKEDVTRVVDAFMQMAL